MRGIRSYLAAAALSFVLAGSRRRQDLQVRLPGRSQCARFLHAQRDLHARHDEQRDGGPDPARQGPQDHPGPRRALGGRRSAEMALLSAQGREIPRRRAVHRRRRDHVDGSRPRARQPGPQQGSGRRQVHQDRRPHHRGAAREAKSDPALRMGRDSHLLEAMGREGGRYQAAIRQGDLGKCVGVDRQRHRPVHDRQPRAGRENRIQALRRMVGQAGPQSRRGDIHDDQVGRDPRRRLAHRRDRHDGSGAGAGHRPDQGQRHAPTC